MLDLDAPLPKSVRPLPKHIPAGAHILSHSDLRAIAKHFGGRDDVRLGEELIPHVLHHGMLGAESGRVIPQETLTDLGNGDPIAGKKVLRKFLDNIRWQPQHYQHGGAVDHDDAVEDLDFAQAHQISKQLGTNPGATFRFPDGDKYIKQPRSERAAREEALTGKLYEAVGVPTAPTQLVRLPDGQLGIASRIIDAEPLEDKRPASINHLHEHFPVGRRKDNVLVDAHGNAYRIDQGGALSFKPRGKPKGSAFGNEVRETKTLLDPRYASSEVFDGVKPDPDNATAQRIAALPDWQIRDLVHRYLGEHDGYGNRGLADKLIARRDDLSRQYGLRQ